MTIKYHGYGDGYFAVIRDWEGRKHGELEYHNENIGYVGSFRTVAEARRAVDKLHNAKLKAFRNHIKTLAEA